MSTCDWSADGDQCRFPGVFSESVTGGARWRCAYHRRSPDQVTGREIIARSHRTMALPNSRDAYLAGRFAEVYAGGDPPAVAELRARLKPRKTSGPSPLAKWLPKRHEAPPEREPGQDDEELAA